ncbi:DedA family protein [Amycolatopsis arida]|nr:VTT domain-containing protein [Amycolatopsis arida]
MLDLLNRLTELLQETIDSPLLWLVVFAVSGLDALLPFMPSETTVITVAVLIGPDPGKLVLLTGTAAAGAWAGDMLGHWLGRRAGPRAVRALRRGERGRERYVWASAKVLRHAPLLIVAGRYLPGGRVASALATGTLRYPMGRFAALDAVGTTLWAVYSVAIGFLGGVSFADEPAKGLLLSFGIGLLVVAAIEVGRRLGFRRAARDLPASDRRPRRRPARGGPRGRLGRPGTDMSGLDGVRAGPAHRPGVLLGVRRDRQPER